MVRDTWCAIVAMRFPRSDTRTNKRNSAPVEATCARCGDHPLFHLRCYLFRGGVLIPTRSRTTNDKITYFISIFQAGLLADAFRELAQNRR